MSTAKPTTRPLKPPGYSSRVDVAFTVYVTDEFRRALRWRSKRTGLATDKEICDWVETSSTSRDSQLMDDYRNREGVE